MDTDLKGLVAGILDDLIDARFRADVTVADLAEHYRENPGMRALSIPALNISSVDVDLRFVFGEPEDEGEVGESLSPQEAAKSVAEGLSASVLRTPVVARTVRTRDERRKLKKALADKVEKSARTSATLSPDERQAVLGTEIFKALRTAKVRNLSDQDRKTLEARIAEADTHFSAALRAGKTVRPRLVTAPETLASVNPEAISRISFTVDLSARRWQAVDSDADEGGLEHYLVDE